MYTFVCFKFKNIGNNEPFPLLVYCALPIAPLDLFECKYCLNDPFPFKKIKSNDAIGRAQYTGNGNYPLLLILYEMLTIKYVHIYSIIGAWV